MASTETYNKMSKKDVVELLLKKDKEIETLMKQRQLLQDGKHEEVIQELEDALKESDSQCENLEEQLENLKKENKTLDEKIYELEEQVDEHEKGNVHSLIKSELLDKIKRLDVPTLQKN